MGETGREAKKKRGNQKKKGAEGGDAGAAGPWWAGGSVAVRDVPWWAPRVPICPQVSPRVPPWAGAGGSLRSAPRIFFFCPAAPVARVAPEHPAGIAAPPAPGGLWGHGEPMGSLRGAGGEMARGN